MRKHADCDMMEWDDVNLVTEYCDDTHDSAEDTRGWHPAHGQRSTNVVQVLGSSGHNTCGGNILMDVGIMAPK